MIALRISLLALKLALTSVSKPCLLISQLFITISLLTFGRQTWRDGKNVSRLAVALLLQFKQKSGKESGSDLDRNSLMNMQLPSLMYPISTLFMEGIWRVRSLDNISFALGSLSQRDSL